MCREKYAEIGCQAEEIELEYMSEAPFDEPRLAINRVYTRQGDGGDTAWSVDTACPRIRNVSKRTERWTS